MDQPRAIRLIALVCAAQVLVQIGAFFWPALLPQMIPRWSLTNSEAGWITAAFYGAYILAVPVLVTLTDRIDAKLVYLSGVAATVAGHALFAALADGFWSALAARALTGIGWAGTYMTGLKLLADTVDGKLLSRAAAGHAASIGISGALSFACADLLANTGGWRLAFYAAAASAAVAWLIVAFTVPRRAVQPHARGRAGAVRFPAGAAQSLRDGLRDRLWPAYAGNERAARLGRRLPGLRRGQHRRLRQRVLADLALTVLGLLGTAASVFGNEAAIYFGRRTLISAAMIGSAVLAGLLAIAGSQSYPLAVALMLIYGVVIWLDSASLTAGTAGSAEPSRRGATLAVHSTLGYLGGFIGPLAVGLALDLGGGNAAAAWAGAFAMIAALMALALVTFLAMRPRGLAGDRGA